MGYISLVVWNIDFCGLHAILSLFVMGNPLHSTLLFGSYILCSWYLTLLVADNTQSGEIIFILELRFMGFKFETF